jgi:hypothetical protein
VRALVAPCVEVLLCSVQGIVQGMNTVGQLYFISALELCCRKGEKDMVDLCGGRGDLNDRGVLFAMLLDPGLDCLAYGTDS